MRKEGKNRSVLGLTDYFILDCLLKTNKLLNNQIAKKIGISKEKVGERLKHLKELKLIKRQKRQKGSGIINFIEEKNQDKIYPFIKIIPKDAL